MTQGISLSLQKQLIQLSPGRPAPRDEQEHFPEQALPRVEAIKADILILVSYIQCLTAALLVTCMPLHVCIMIIHSSSTPACYHQHGSEYHPQGHHGGSRQHSHSHHGERSEHHPHGHHGSS